MSKKKHNKPNIKPFYFLYFRKLKGNYVELYGTYNDSKGYRICIKRCHFNEFVKQGVIPSLLDDNILMFQAYESKNGKLYALTNLKVYEKTSCFVEIGA